MKSSSTSSHSLNFNKQIKLNGYLLAVTYNRMAYLSPLLKVHGSESQFSILNSRTSDTDPKNVKSVFQL